MNMKTKNLFTGEKETVPKGVTIPAFSHLTARWAPKLERTLFYGLGLAGCSLGLVICYPVAGSLCTVDFLNGHNETKFDVIFIGIF